MSDNSPTFALQIVEANHDDDAFWTLAIGDYNSQQDLDTAFDRLSSEPRREDSTQDYIIDKLVDGDITEEKFVSAETVERLTGRKVGRMRAGAKNSLRAEIARHDKKKATK